MLWPIGFQKTAAVRGALLCVLVTACSDAPNNDVDSARAELQCRAGVIELDLDSQPLQGSGIDPDTGKLQLPEGNAYVVSSTYGIPKRDSVGMPLSPHYQALMGRIIEQLQQQDGLLALQLSSSSSCGSGRTLAVWESEEAMYAFVSSAPHLEAIQSVHELLQPGYAVTHWSATSTEQATLTAAAEHLTDAVRE